MRSLFRLLCALVGTFVLSAAPALADTQDIAAAARGVVRVILVATNGTEAYFVGHGSGVAVAPDKILTNAHVVELTREEKQIVIGVIPSQGNRSYGGKVIAYSPGNDLALIQLDQGNIPVDTFYSGAAQDGQPVVAIGYPGTVDRAQGLNLQDMIEPLSPVKSSGTISAGRSSRQFDTLLHTAPMAAGNSGGPLVDVCGRIVGINSFGSVSDGNDAEFGFAISNREVFSFLRQAGVQFRRTNVECKSPEQAQEEETRRAAEEMARQEARDRATADARRAALTKAHDEAEQQVIGARENHLALAALLLALAILGCGGAGLMLTQDRRRPAIALGAGAGVLFLAALLVYLTRPSFNSIEDRARELLPKDHGGAAAAAYKAAGPNLCRIDEARSRITVSETDDVPLDWTGTGCVNGRTQFSEGESRWNRIFVPKGEAMIDIRSFDPETGTYIVDRYLPDASVVDAARQIRDRYTGDACTTDGKALAALSAMDADIRAILPPRPNEHLVYHCKPGQ